MTDSKDIVDRLRDLGDHAAFEPLMYHLAADEIERLQKRVDELDQRDREVESLIGEPDKKPLRGSPSKKP